jgi:hypothetical protein
MIALYPRQVLEDEMFQITIINARRRQRRLGSRKVIGNRLINSASMLVALSDQQVGHDLLLHVMLRLVNWLPCTNCERHKSKGKFSALRDRSSSELGWYV